MVHVENEYATAKFLHENLPCNCLKDLKRRLKHSPRLSRCMNCKCAKVLLSKRMKVCGGCQNAFYCSETCQKADWGKHKVFCKQARGTNITGKKYDTSGLPASTAPSPK